ncbi:uncharacterized protein LOC115750418 [Rhodamnia argentea]|uniref:Uncharacterized protein LOC115750418 n=1 Tax=Rhodamnia argentea TaxID=178133 RepID=A0A8B8QAR4_9MYRT|nr:uncharacterized protein LOC115750418 [Rhodamnia argentea]
MEASRWSDGWSPTGAPATALQREDHWRHFDNSVNAVSFGFVATAILISMFLVMAIFERFLRTTSPEFSAAAAGDRGRRGRGGGGGGDLESQMGFNPKLNYPSPKMTVCTSGVSVVMPGDSVPTFIARPAPVPCPPERVSWPLHQHLPFPHHPAEGTSSNRSSSPTQ